MQVCLFFSCGLLVLSLVGSFCDGYSAIMEADVEDGKCLGEDGRPHAVGESWYEDVFCEEYTCFFNGYKHYDDITGCELPEVPDGCRLQSDQPGNYPDCCPILVCNTNES